MGQIIRLDEYKEKQFQKELRQAYNEEVYNTIERIFDKIDLYPKIYTDPSACFTKLKVIENFIDMELSRDIELAKQMLLNNSKKGDPDNDKC